MRFELIGRLVFDADDIQDAFVRLAAHFRALSKSEESDLPLVGTNLKVREVGSKTPVPPPNGRTVTYRGSRKT